MKNFTKKLFMFTSILAVTAIVGGCSSNDSKNVKSSDGMEYYQTQEHADVKRVTAKMYTHSSNGGESKMGDIKFHETDNGLRMAVDLKDLRPGVEYTIHIYKMKCPKMDKHNKDSKKKCDKDEVSVNLPTLRTDHTGELVETFMIRGLTAAELKDAKLVLSREGSDRAAWGKLEKTMF